MEPEDMTTSKKSMFFKVTPLSKYLAMILFIIMPFVGGYVGYRYAPEKVVPVEKEKITQSQVNENIQQTSDVQNEKLLSISETEEGDVSQTSNARSEELSSVAEIQKMFLHGELENYEIETLYTTSGGDIEYFKLFKPSSAPIRIYKYIAEFNSFHETGISIDAVVGEEHSPTGRYIVNAPHETYLVIYDLETQSVEHDMMLSEQETLIAATCGYAGYSYDLKWIDDRTLQYGVYKPLEDEEGCPEMELVGYRTLKME